MLTTDPAPALALRVVCAWCGREMRPGTDPPSHGICAGCEVGWLDRAGVGRGPGARDEGLTRD